MPGSLSCWGWGAEGRSEGGGGSGGLSAGLGDSVSRAGAALGCGTEWERGTDTPTSQGSQYPAGNFVHAGSAGAQRAAAGAANALE